MQTPAPKRKPATPLGMAGSFCQSSQSCVPRRKEPTPASSRSWCASTKRTHFRLLVQPQFYAPPSLTCSCSKRYIFHSSEGFSGGALSQNLPICASSQSAACSGLSMPRPIPAAPGPCRSLCRSPLRPWRASSTFVSHPCTSTPFVYHQGPQRARLPPPARAWLHLPICGAICESEPLFAKTTHFLEINANDRATPGHRLQGRFSPPGDAAVFIAHNTHPACHRSPCIEGDEKFSKLTRK